MINLTQHVATPEQVEAGVVDLPDSIREEIQKFLTFDTAPVSGEIYSRAAKIADIASDIIGADSAMIDGPSFLMSALENALKERGITPYYAFTTRDVVEVEGENGEIRKTEVFRHAGFIPIW